MTRVMYIKACGEPVTVIANPGSNLMQVAVDNMIEGIDADCGGSCSCGTCHCYIDAAWLDRVGEASDSERDTLECVANFDPVRSRLSCQVQVDEGHDGLVVHLPSAQGY